MNRTVWLGLALGTTLAFAGDPLLGQGGTNCCQILQIPSASFTPRSSTVTYEYGNAGYIYLTSTGSQPSNQMWASVVLPSGARILYLGLFFYDNDSTNDITATLRRFTGGRPSGSGPPAFSDVDSIASSGTPLFGYDNQGVAEVVLNDVANDANAAQYAVLVDFPIATANLQFKAAEIWWQRQVSPAPAVPTFNDVPASDTGFAFIEALTGSGITAGCGGGNYCPDAPLTRRQMAVFLAKALGLHWPF